MALLQLGGASAEYTKRPYDFSTSFMLKSLLLIDTIQPFGAEYRYLISSLQSCPPSGSVSTSNLGIYVLGFVFQFQYDLSL